MTNFYKGTNGFNEPPKPIFTTSLPPKYLPSTSSHSKLPTKYCAPVKTPLKDIVWGAPPYQYDVSGKQPADLVMLKAMHNSILSSVLDGTQGVVPGESFTQQKILNNLKSSIDKFCE
jgi:hypothetical protein